MLIPVKTAKRKMTKRGAEVKRVSVTFIGYERFGGECYTLSGDEMALLRALLWLHDGGQSARVDGETVRVLVSPEVLYLIARRTGGYRGEEQNFYRALISVVLFNDYGILAEHGEHGEHRIWLSLTQLVRSDVAPELAGGRERVLDIRFIPGVVRMAVEEYEEPNNDR